MRTQNRHNDGGGPLPIATRHLDENLSLGALSEEFELSSYLNCSSHRSHTPWTFFFKDFENEGRHHIKLYTPKLHRTHLVPGLSGPLACFLRIFRKVKLGILTDEVSGEGEKEQQDMYFLLSHKTIL